MDCFANKNGICQILNTGDLRNRCLGEEICKFCKTNEQVTLERANSITRINKLPEAKKQKILDTYRI